MENIKLNQIFGTLTIIFFGLGMLCVFGEACALPTPNLVGLYFTIAKICAVCFIATKTIGAIARKEIVL